MSLGDYDQWKTTPPEERYGVLTCESCGEELPNGRRECCPACEDMVLADEAFVDFYQWEPVR